MDNIINRIDELIKIINKASYEYYVNDAPTITDQEYDDAYNELLSLEKKYPELKRDDSPTNRVGGEAIAPSVVGSETSQASVGGQAGEEFGVVYGIDQIGAGVGGVTGGSGESITIHIIGTYIDSNSIAIGGIAWSEVVNNKVRGRQ